MQKLEIRFLVKIITLAILFVVIIILTYQYLATSYPYLFKNLPHAILQIAPSIFPTSSLQPEINPNPSATRSPHPLIPDNGSAGNFTISQSGSKELAFTKLSLDPLNAYPPTEISLTLTLISPTPITKIVGTITTNNKPISLRLSPISRENNTEIWHTKFVLNQPISYKYIYHFSASNSITTTLYDIALRQ